MTFVSCIAMVKRPIICLFVILLTTFARGQTFTNVEPIQEVGSEYKVTAFTLDKDNNKYVGTNKGLVRISTAGVVETLYSGGAVLAIVWHRQAGIWIGVDGNKVYQPATGTQIKLEGENIRINAMALSGSQVWVGTNNGVYVVSTKTQKVIEHFTTSNTKMESNVINDIFIDGSRLKWIGTDMGIARVENKKWKMYEKDYQFTAITGNSEGTWIAAGTEMWLVDQYNRWARTGVSDGLSYGSIRALAADQKGKIYILSEILVQFDPYSDVHVEIENEFSLQGGDDVALLVDMNDKVWVGTLEHGLTAMDVDVSVDQPLTAYMSVIHPVCNGEATGSLSVAAQGGRPPYTYKWNDGELSGPSLGVLKQGDYAVTVTDADGFTYSLEVALKDPKPMGLTLMANESNGSVEALVTGGAGGYTYEWSNGASTYVATNLEEGSHEVVVTDNSGCNVSAIHHQKAAVVADPEVIVAATDSASSDLASNEALDPADSDPTLTDPTSTAINYSETAKGTNPATGAGVVLASAAASASISTTESDSTSASNSDSTSPSEPGVTPSITPAITLAITPTVISAVELEAVDKEVLKTLDPATLAVGQTLRIDQLSFDADSTTINNESKAVLDEVYEFLKSNDRIIVEIGGHTNGLPEHDYCDKLSKARAQSVADYLYNRGIASGRIASKGYGKREPLATNSTVAGRRKNQRVELKVLEI